MAAGLVNKPRLAAQQNCSEASTETCELWKQQHLSDAPLPNTLFKRGVSDSLLPWTKGLTATQLCKNLYSANPSMKNQSVTRGVGDVPLPRVKRTH